MKVELPSINDNSPETELLRLVDKAFYLQAAAWDIRTELSQLVKPELTESQFRVQISLGCVSCACVPFATTFHPIKPRLASWYERRSNSLLAQADKAITSQSS